jgi:hypothetical protein
MNGDLFITLLVGGLKVETYISIPYIVTSLIKINLEHKEKQNQ